MRRVALHMVRSWRIALVIVLGAGVVLSGCDDLLGSKKDLTTDEIFEAGRQEPGLISEVEYVPVFPFFTEGADGAALDSPQDVYVGYDELIYVVDSRGLHILDRAGRGAAFVDIPGGGTTVVQDRRLHVYVTARRDTLLNGRTWNLPVILHYDRLDGGTPRLADIIWHPFDEDSRKFSKPDPIDTDEQVSFTGVGVMFNNHIFVSRRGPVNERGSVILPHNAVLEFNAEGRNLQAIPSLHPTRESLRSSLFPTDITTFVHPPQRSSFNQSFHFLLSQSPTSDDIIGGGSAPAVPMRFSVLSIRAVLTTDGIVYQPDPDMLRAASNPDKGDGFLYDEFKFTNPSDLTIAADNTNYMFVVDAGSDSLFVFTGAGIEGVAAPPGSRSTKPVVVSFGGTGDGATQFDQPMGVAYFDEIVLVADTGNNRLSRFRLNTDFE